MQSAGTPEWYAPSASPTPSSSAPSTTPPSTPVKRASFASIAECRRSSPASWTGIAGYSKERRADMGAIHIPVRARVAPFALSGIDERHLPGIFGDFREIVSLRRDEAARERRRDLADVFDHLLR